MVERMHIGRLAAFGEFDRMRIGLIEDRTMNQHIGARCGNRSAHVRCRRLRHDDRNRHAKCPSGIGCGNAGIAAGGAEDLTRTVLNLMLAKPADTTQLEAA